jgi:hypothetical protein
MDPIVDYYRDIAVRRRMLEFLGARHELSEATAMFITAGAAAGPRFDPLPVGELWRCLEEGMDVGRSLWDRAGLIAHLDLDYVNFNQPARGYHDRDRGYGVQRPVARAAVQLLRSFGIRPLHLYSGMGHHFLWQVARASAAFDRLAELGRLPSSLVSRYSRRQPPCEERVGLELGRAFSGLGMVMEFITHRLMADAAGACDVPIRATAVEPVEETAPEIVAIDISEYGDALISRAVRMPYSVYLKGRQRGWAAEGPSAIPSFSVPAAGLTETDALTAMQDPALMAEVARWSSVAIPECAAGTAALTEAYRSSPLADFHAWFYSQSQHPPDQWPITYDVVALDELPPCAANALRHPNDALVKPGYMRHVVGHLLTAGWHPRHIAGLLRSKYERDHGWLEYWYQHDATSRADFYTRLFAGLFLLGVDDPGTLACFSPPAVAHLAAARRRLGEWRASHV